MTYTIFEIQVLPGCTIVPATWRIVHNPEHKSPPRGLVRKIRGKPAYTSAPRSGTGFGPFTWPDKKTPSSNLWRLCKPSERTFEMIEMLEPIPSSVAHLRGRFLAMAAGGFNYQTILQEALKEAQRYGASGAYVSTLRFFEADELTQGALEDTPRKLWDAVAPRLDRTVYEQQNAVLDMVGPAAYRIPVSANDMEQWLGQTLQAVCRRAGSSNIESTSRVMTLLAVGARYGGKSITPPEVLMACHEIILADLTVGGNMFFQEGL